MIQRERERERERCIYVYIYISLSLSLYIYIYIYIFTFLTSCSRTLFSRKPLTTLENEYNNWVVNCFLENEVLEKKANDVYKYCMLGSTPYLFASCHLPYAPHTTVSLFYWVLIKGGCSRRGVQWMGVVSYNKTACSIL